LSVDVSSNESIVRFSILLKVRKVWKNMQYIQVLCRLDVFLY
jgi:hypothetical protein